MLPAVNTLFNALLQHPSSRASTSRTCACRRPVAWQPSEGTAKQWQKVTGSTMIEGWGMSETCAIGTNNPVTTPNSPAPSACRCPASTSPSRTTRATACHRASGEICIRGPNVMTGYYNQPEENAKAFTADGFMRTGDIGIMDEQRLHQASWTARRT
jgi:long-chain acyl-CoA synthetase